MSIVSISKKEFDLHQPLRAPMSEQMVKEVEWFEDNSGVVIGLVGMDTTDKDWMYVILGPDENGIMRAISVDSSIDSQEEAKDQLLNKMQEFSDSGEKVFSQE